MLPRLSLRRPASLPPATGDQPPTTSYQPPATRYLPLAAALLAFALYAGTLDLPFFQDDFAHLRWLADRGSPLDPFLTAANLPAYRPLGEALLKAWYLVLGRNDPAWLRFLNVSLHALNTALVAALALRLDGGRGRRVTAGAAALLFAALPFAYQAVPWINVFFYPLNNFLQLGMALAYWEGRVRRSNRLVLLALALAFLSMFEIEYGLLNGGLLLVLELALWLQGRQKAVWLRGPAAGLALAVLFLLLRAQVPRDAYGFGAPTAERVFQIAFYLLQGLAGPAAPLARPLMNAAGLSDLAAVGLVGLPAVLLVGVFLWRRGRRAIVVASLLWFGLLQLPGLLTLDFAYYLNSPRLLYPTGPAMAWLWGAAVAQAAAPGQARLARAAAAGLALLAALWVGVDFIRVRLDHYHVVGDTVYELAAAARLAPPSEPILAVNLPSWLTPPERTFALGTNGVQFIPFYVGLDAVVFSVNDASHPVEAIQFHNIRPAMPYAYGMYGPSAGWDEVRAALAAAGDVYVTHYSPERATLRPAGRVTWLAAAAAPPLATFAEQVALSLAEHRLVGDAVELRLDWRLLAEVEADLSVFVHLYGPDGALVAQDDGYPLAGLSPFWLWEAGRAVRDVRRLVWPAEAPPGVYRVGVGIYDPASAARLPAHDAAGRPFPDDAAIVLEIGRP